MLKKVNVDIAILGAGITGLWALNRLSQLGYSVALFESHCIGGGQTLKSQGIIHGGLKYALTGLLTESANQIESMPTRWKACLRGEGEIDLQTVNRLSEEQLLFSDGHLSSALSTFFASKLLKSRIQKLTSKNYPSFLQHPSFKGAVYRLEEMVLDTRSLVETLYKPYQNQIFKIDPVQGCQIHWQQNQIENLHLQSEQNTLELTADRYLFFAGEGNAQLLQNDVLAPTMQCRPLHMVLVCLPETHMLYAHCIDHHANPRLTITSHRTKQGHCVWYLGGQLAEEGVHRTQTEQIDFTKRELKALFPWLNLEQAHFTSFRINRAEAYQSNGKRPDSFSLQKYHNAIIGWPTKLALAPLLTDKLISMLQEDSIRPKSQNNFDLSNWQKPLLGQHCSEFFSNTERCIPCS